MRWIRTSRSEQVDLTLPAEQATPNPVPVPNSGGIELVVLARTLREMRDIPTAAPAGTRALSVFVVNRRRPDTDEVRDQAFLRFGVENFPPERGYRRPKLTHPR